MWEIESGQYMWVGNREWAIYVGWEIESGQYMWVGNREWAIFVLE